MTYGTMERIQTVTVGSGGAANIEFTNIPQTYDDLVVKMSTRNTATGVGDWQAFEIGFNGVTTNRSFRFLGGTGSAAISGSGTAIYGQSSSGSTTANTFANGEIYIPNYRSSNNKSLSIDQVTENNATSALIYPVAGLWSSTAAITSIQLASSLAGTFAQHSTATLYGITRVPAGAKATGGVIYDDSSFWYHVFTSSGTFTPSQTLTADVLCIAGGGGGGSTVGGGGGAGGLRNLTSQSFGSGNNFTVTVGAGGAGGTSSNRGANGNNSSVSGTGLTTITATAGGAGGGNNQNTGNSGGSGGGSASFNGTGAGTGNAGSYSPAEGTNGGTDTGGGTFTKGGGGGGGATVAGGNAGSGVGGTGGDGSSSFSSWLVATNSGVDVSGTRWIAGGGGGGAGIDPTGSGGAGGKGGGASWSQTSGAMANAIANTGGGGAGGGQNADTSARSGSAGGSGIVIVRYAK